ncbi:uroporphyrin-III C-methyltransferase [Lecanora helva]
MSRSRAFASRRPRYSANKAPLNPLSDADEEEDDDSPPFLPFSNTKPTTPPPPTDPGATLKISPKPTKPPPKTRRPAPEDSSLATHRQALASQTPHSSSSSAQSQAHLRHQPAGSNNNPLSALSPKQRRAAKEGGSDGTPSMGSSFSDLDDASVTQSALEEALANEMTQGGIGSRMSTISQALRSRYL